MISESADSVGPIRTTDYRLTGAPTLPTKPSQLLVAAVVLVAGLAGAPNRPREAGTSAPSPTAPAGGVIVDRAGRIARVIRGYEGEASPIVAALAAQGLPLPGFEGVVKAVPVERVPAAER